MHKINKLKFLIPFLMLVITIGISFFAKEGFIIGVNTANTWILDHFGWLFSWSTFVFLIILLVVYISPLGRMKIGGSNAVPILSRWRWFAITICTTIATGILFWGAAEPLYHLRDTPIGLGIDSGSADATIFAMSTMFMHWTFTPYGIYTIMALLFALVYYNLRQDFSLGAVVYPLLGRKPPKAVSNAIDIICLYALVAGMAAALGAGMLTISGGLHTVLGINEGPSLIALIGIAIVATFIISASSGLHKGIKILSSYNVLGFFFIALVILVLGPVGDMISLGFKGLSDYVVHFIPRSLIIGDSLDDTWLHSWTVYYLANWMAWAPIAAMFLGKISVGYTVRSFIHFNLLYPSLFSIIWMIIFSGASLSIDLNGAGHLYNILSAHGEQNVIFTIFDSLSVGPWLGLFFTFLVFLSFVTAADSNTTAMSGICAVDMSPDQDEAPIAIKVAWGLVIGTLSFVMVTYTGIDGVRMLSVLGGFPALFLVIIAALSLMVLLIKRKTLLREE